MGAVYSQLSLQERRKIESWWHAKVPVREMARVLNRHKSTIFREIKRNFWADDAFPKKYAGYFGHAAQLQTNKRRSVQRKLIRHPELCKTVIARIKQGWSPEQIAGRLKLEGHATSVSHETIYAYVHSPDGQSQALARYLPERRKRRKPRYSRTPRGMMFPLERSIHNRPEHIKNRSTFGEWEGDLMIFRREHGKANVASLVERKTRFAVLFRNNDRSSKHFIAKLMNVLEASLNQIPQSIQWAINTNTLLSGLPHWDHRSDVSAAHLVTNAVGIVPLVGQKH